MGTSGPLMVHLRSTSGPFAVHLGIGGHMRHHSYILPKKLMFTKFAHGLLKIPFTINARSGSKKVTIVYSTK